MKRWLSGIFDPSGRADSSRLAHVFAPQPSTLVAYGPLQVVYTGPANDHSGPLCLLDGYFDNASELAALLRVPPDSPPEQVLAAGWQRWERELVARMRGDFALIVWDPRREEGLMARDQMGVRSIFLHDGSDGLYFASEVRQMLALLPSRPGPDPASLAHWLTMGSRPGPATLYMGIRRLNPGAMLLLDRKGVREERYWTPRFAEPLDATEPDLAQQVRTALDRAVARRISPNGLSGVLMSGGLDSASVAAIAAIQAPGRILSYSAVFPEHPDVDESALIAELRTTFDLPGITAEVRAGGMLASALAAIATWELPIRSWGDFWGLPLLRAAASAGAHVTLGGDGGDELFGPRSYMLADRLLAGHPLQALRLVRELPGAGYGPERREIVRMVASMAVMGALPYRPHNLLRRPLAGRNAPSWLRPETTRNLLESGDPLAWKRLDGPRWWANIAHGLTRGIEEAGMFEHQRQRASSAGLEARHPLFDLDVVEIGLRQPPLATFDPYRSRPVLRAAMAGVLPDSVRLRPQKALFNSLLIDSLAGSDGIQIRRLLRDPQAELRAYIDQSDLQRTLLEGDPHLREDPFQWMWQVWRLVNAECWLRAQSKSGLHPLLGDQDASAARIAILGPTNPAKADSSVFPP